MAEVTYLTKEAFAAQLNGIPLGYLTTRKKNWAKAVRDNIDLVVAYAYDTEDWNECVAIRCGIEDDITLGVDGKLFIYPNLNGGYCFGDQEEYGKDNAEEVPVNQPFIERKVVILDEQKGVYEMTSSLPFAPFTIHKQGRPYCVGLVYSRADLDAQLAKL